MGGKAKDSRGRRESPLQKAMRQGIRQLRYPKGIRIQPPSEIPLDAVEPISGDTGLTPWEATPLAKLFPPETLIRFFADLGTGLWRMKRRMVDPQTGNPLEEMRGPYRHFETVWDLFDSARIHIHDHTGEVLPKGGFTDLHVLEYQPKPGLIRECVIETIRPTISIKGSGANPDLVIQVGEVIVGKPDHPSDEHIQQS